MEAEKKNPYTENSPDISETDGLKDDLTRQREFYQSILENIPTDIAIFDADHRYLYVNPHGIKSEELRKYIIGKDDFEYLKYRGKDPSLAAVRREKFEEMKSTGQVVVWEDSIVNANGETQTTLRKFYPVYGPDKKLNLVIGFGVDITDQKKAEEFAKNLNLELEEKIQERTNDLRIANEELNTFNSMVSHDLQAPLRSLSGFSRILLNEYNDKLDTDGKELLGMIEQNAKHMSTLIKGLLKFGQLGKAPLTMAHVNMNDMLRDVVNEIKATIIHTKVQLKVNELASCSCDELLIKQVWYNLLGNAVKYSSKIKSPKIEIGCIQDAIEMVYYVKDNGAGFDMRFADNLFQIFHRLHTVNEFEGTGVGLALVHRIITKHGGRIWAESKPDEGATFYFTLK